MRRNLNVIDLFCGCGGLSQGLEKSGMKIRLGVDNDLSALNTFSSSHSDALIMAHDLAQLNISEFNELIDETDISIIAGGPPCQGLSLSGSRKKDDPRNKLFYAYTKLINHYRPKAIILENVPGIISLFKGSIKKAILSEFEKLGYSVQYNILNSADFGVPQTRKRVFFVGIRKDLNKEFLFPVATHCSNENLEKNMKKYITCEEALNDLPTLENYLGEEIQEYASKPRSGYQKYIRNNSTVVQNHIAANHSTHVQETIKLVPEGGNYKNLPSDFISTRKFNVAWTRFHSKKPAPTIDTGHRHHFHYKYNRVPTVRECARLQSFSDNVVFHGNKTQQFRQVGNAVPPILAYKIGEALKKCL